MEQRVSDTRMVNLMSESADLAAALSKLNMGREAVQRVVVGQVDVIDQVIMALLAGGHVLIESAPGLGKTLLVRTLGTVFGLKFHRIQFTPDLMPADITGTYALVTGEQGGGMTTRFQPGPVFAQMVLADEINRATPKTQSSLLEAMQEGTVTVMGVEYELPRPFFVLATQNPIEMEGTYILPEAQIDRFLFKVTLGFPQQTVLERIVEATTGVEEQMAEIVLSGEEVLALQRWTRQVPLSTELRSVVARSVRATQPELPEAPDRVRRFVRYGVSPRGAQALVLAAKARALLSGRFNVSFEDVKAVALPALRHRVQLNFEGQAAGTTVDELIDDVFGSIAHRSR